MRISIAAKIISIAVVVIAAMTAVSVVNLETSRRVAAGIEQITNGYFAIYGAIARVNIYGTEEAYRTRQYIIEKTLGMHYDGGDLKSTLARLTELDGLVHSNLDAARQTVATELANPDTLSDRATLARIDERLAWIEDEEKTHLDRQVKLMDALDRGDIAQFRDGFDDLTKWRADYDSYMEATLQMIFDAASNAGNRVTASQARAQQFSFVLLVLACMLAVGMAFVLTRQIVRPLRELLVGVRAIAAGKLDVQVQVKTSDEVGRLTEAFNDMTRELRVGFRARDLFGKYIDSRIARALIEVPHTLGQDGERRMMTVMFCDLEGFTRTSEQLTPRGLVAVMNRYFTLMSDVIHENDGVIDKFIGDAVMAYWGAPFVPEGIQGVRAVSSAVAQLDRIGALEAELPDLVNMKRGLPAVKLRIGIATGDVLVGSIGSDTMRNFTVMGDAVNLASRLEGANKLYGTHILLDEGTAQSVGDEIELREIDSLVVVGQSEPTRIFEAMGRAGALSADQMAARDDFQQGLKEYRRREWDAAQAAFGRALGHMPNDPPSLLFLSRVAALKANPPASDWTGAWVMETK